MGVLLSLFPGKLYIYVAVLLAAVSAGGFSGWKVHSLLQATKERDYAQQVLVDQQRQAAETFRRSERVIAAQSAGTARMASLIRDVGSARDALDGLRIESERGLRAAASSLAACTAYGATQSVVLLELGKQATEIAASADVWANYARTVNESK